MLYVPFLHTVSAVPVTPHLPLTTDWKPGLSQADSFRPGPAEKPCHSVDCQGALCSQHGVDRAERRLGKTPLSSPQAKLLPNILTAESHVRCNLFVAIL